MDNIREVAKLAGVSVPTAYKVFSKAYDTSEKTKRKVLEAARQLDYISKNEKKQREENIVGIVVGSIENSFFNGLIDSLLKEFGRYQYNTIVLYCNGNPEQLKYNLELLGHIGAKAIIFEPMIQERHDIVYHLKTKGIVLLQLFTTVYPEIDTLKFDDELGTYTAVKELLKCGHTNIAMFYKKWDICPEREPGYEKAFMEMGIPIRRDNLCKMDYTKNIGSILKDKICSLCPTAILSVNETMTINILQVLDELKLSVPDDISLIVYDDLPWMQALNLTAISHPFDKIGESASEMILNKLRDKTDSSEAAVLEINPILISRGSTKILDSFIK